MKNKNDNKIEKMVWNLYYKEDDYLERILLVGLLVELKKLRNEVNSKKCLIVKSKKFCVWKRGKK